MVIINSHVGCASTSSACVSFYQFVLNSNCLLRKRIVPYLIYNESVIRECKEVASSLTAHTYTHSVYSVADFFAVLSEAAQKSAFEESKLADKVVVN